MNVHVFSKVTAKLKKLKEWKHLVSDRTNYLSHPPLKFIYALDFKLSEIKQSFLFSVLFQTTENKNSLNSL